MADLILKGVRQNNLKNVDVVLPLGKSIVVTGPSGSGKSSLAFETVYAEGQRRYMQSLSTYARQFLERFQAPDADQILHIPPTIALEQVNPVRNSRATVGTTTEIYDYLRLVFEKIGTEFCDDCKVPMERLSFGEIFEKTQAAFATRTLLMGFRRKVPRGGTKDTLEGLMRSGFSRVLVEGSVHAIEDLLGVGKALRGEILVIVDRVRLGAAAESSIQTRFTEALKSAMEYGGTQEAEAFVEHGDKYERVGSLTTQSRCPSCLKIAPPKTAISFSFNSPLGACEHCKGFGNILEVDPALVIPNPKLTLARGAIDPFSKPSLKAWQKKMLAFCKVARIDEDLPYAELPAEHQALIWAGDKRFPGVKGVFEQLQKDKYKMQIRVFISRYTSPFLCSACQGARLNRAALRVRVGNQTIAEVTEFTIAECQAFFSELVLSAREKQIVSDVLKQVARRLDYLVTVGLGYLTLSRLTRSLSGGEYQRILLATQLSQGLTDTLYVLDEPSIGLHPKDTDRLLEILGRLSNQGNTLLVVEHDPEMIEWGEHVIEMGPGSGKRGGEVIFAGTQRDFLRSGCSTANAIKHWRRECRKSMERAVHLSEKWLELEGACENNLKNVDIRFPLSNLVVVTGVSGSGKSTLIVDTLYQALAKVFHGRSEKIGRFESLSGFEHLSSVELVDQSSIGKSSRSNPITFLKGYDEVRSLFASSPDAQGKQLTPGQFSFNIPGGRCDTCEGEGRVKVDMVFLEDVYVPCEVCNEKRFKPHILAVQYKGRNIDEVLRMTVDEAHDFFKASNGLRSKLALLQQVGLGYLQLGQPGFTLSGGEAQRLKIARELAGGTESRLPTLFVLDEPTTGLHFHEIEKLIQVFHHLKVAGHSILVIEHNLQMICAADYLIDLGPDGGENGGTVVAMGTPLSVANKALPHTGRYLAEILDEG